MCAYIAHTWFACVQPLCKNGSVCNTCLRMMNTYNLCRFLCVTSISPMCEYASVFCLGVCVFVFWCVCVSVCSFICVSAIPEMCKNVVETFMDVLTVTNFFRWHVMRLYLFSLTCDVLVEGDEARFIYISDVSKIPADTMRIIKTGPQPKVMTLCE